MKNDSDGGRDDRLSRNAPKRKPYTPPVLRVYGDVAELTRAVANVSTVPDGGNGTMKKTH